MPLGLVRVETPCEGAAQLDVQTTVMLKYASASLQRHVVWTVRLAMFLADDHVD